MIPIENNGSVVIYHRLIRPYFLKHQGTADEVLDKLGKRAKNLVGEVIKDKSN